MRRNSFPNYITRTGARFEKTEDIIKNTITVNTSKSELERVGVPLTNLGNNEYATSPDEMHCFIIGDSGCGKTRKVILPTIRLMAKTGESMVIADPKGELYRTTGNILRDKGYNVQILNFRNPSRGNRWNPLSIIDSYYHSGDAEKKDKAVMMLGDIVSVLAKDKEGKDPFWINSASNVFTGIALLILEYGGKGELTFENVALTARKFHSQICSGDQSVRKFIHSLPESSPIVNNLSVIITNAKDTRDCIMAEFEMLISMYYTQESLMDLFSQSEIDITELGEKPTALFFILPDDTEALYPIATVFVKQIYSALVTLADSQKNGELPNRVTFLLDEFANFAKMPSIASMLTAARSRGMRFVLVCQSLDQLADKYNENTKETLIANCRVWIYMSCRNLPFLERLEKLMGYYYYGDSQRQEKRPLISVDELQQFDKEAGQVLVLNDRCRPIMGYLKDYSEYVFGDEESTDLGELPPPHKPIKRKIFDFERAIKQARKSYMDRISNDETEENKAAGELHAKILETMANRQSQSKDVEDGILNPTPKLTETKGTSHEDVVEILAQIDKEIEELERQDAEIEYVKAQGVITAGKSAVDYFLEDRYIEGINLCIAESPFDTIANKNNTAFLLRFGKVDSSKIDTDISMDIQELLEEGVRCREPYSLTNLALYKIESKDYKAAVDLFSKIKEDDWEKICKFWYYIVFKEKNNHPEGALVCLTAEFFGYDISFITDYDSIINIANHAYSDFISNMYSTESIENESTSDIDGDTAQTNKEETSDLETKFESLLEEDDQDDDGDDSGDGGGSKTDSLTLLQKKIQDKLDADQKED